MHCLLRPASACLLALLLSAAGHAAVEGTTAEEFLYTVRPGDSAWTISARFLRDQGNWKALRQSNQLRSDLLRPGQVLRIPTPWLRLTTPEARLTGLQGEVMLDSGTGWTAARADTVLPPGTWLRTADNGTATLVLQDGTRVLVRPASELRVLPLEPAQRDAWLKAQAGAPAPPPGQTTETTAPLCIELLRGGLENAVQPQAGKNRFEIRTPSAITTVRGTEFRISTDGQTSRAEVVHGAVAFGNPLGAVELATATGSRADAGVQPTAAVPLLPAPEIQSIPEPASPAQLQTLTLPALDGAVAYRVQWLTDTSPVDLLQESVRETLQPQFPDLPDGRYRLRVRGIDAMGLEGLSAERALAVSTPPPLPPLPAAPRLAIGRADQRLALRWSPPEDARDSFQVQIALDAAFTSLVLDEPTPHHHLLLPRPQRPGFHHIRVRVLQPSGGRSGWSEPRVFDPRSPQESPP